MLRGMTNPGAGSAPAGQGGRGYPAYWGHAPPLSAKAKQSHGAVALPVSQQPARWQTLMSGVSICIPVSTTAWYWPGRCTCSQRALSRQALCNLPGSSVAPFRTWPGTQAQGPCLFERYTSCVLCHQILALSQRTCGLERAVCTKAVQRGNAYVALHLLQPTCALQRPGFAICVARHILQQPVL